MSTVAEKLQLLKEKNAHINLGGGKEKIEAQHRAGKINPLIGSAIAAGVLLAILG